jgi:hypothetical protein
MTCDFWPAVWNGNFYYGFNKSLAPIRWHDGRFSVGDSPARLRFDAVVRSVRRGRGSALDVIRAAVALPVLGRRRDGRFVRTHFEWQLDRAVVESASLTLRTLGRDFEGLPVQAGSAPGDAYHVRDMRWRLGWPNTVLSR